MKKWYILMLLMSLWFIGAQAQETVRGVVTDAAGEPFLYYLSSSEEYCYTCFASILLYTFTHTGISEIVCA